MSRLLTGILLSLLVVTGSLALPHKRTPNITDLLASLQQLQLKTAQLLPAYRSDPAGAAALAGMSTKEEILAAINRKHQLTSAGIGMVTKDQGNTVADKPIQIDPSPSTTVALPEKVTQAPVVSTTSGPSPWFGQFYMGGSDAAEPSGPIVDNPNAVPEGTVNVAQEVPPPPTDMKVINVPFSDYPGANNALPEGPIHGGWTFWTDWGPCNATCGTGYQRRTRDCTNPLPANGGFDCYEHFEEFKLCYHQTPCPDAKPQDPMLIDNLSPFTQEEIRLTLQMLAGQHQNGKTNFMNTSFIPDFKQQPNQIRSQTPLVNPEQKMQLTNKFKQVGTIDVNALTDLQSEMVHTYPAGPLNTMLKDKQTRNQIDMFQGQGHVFEGLATPPVDVAAGSLMMTTTTSMPLFGTWSPWSAWTWCDVTCGDGLQQRTRMCEEPPLVHGGIACSGEDTQTRVCNQEPCFNSLGPATWSEWLQWGPCDATCSSGMQVRIRLCRGPSGLPGSCGGHDYESRPCDLPVCPVDGGWSLWSVWGECDRVCGGGTSIRTRQCNDPLPAFGGQVCTGPEIDSQPCNEQACPVPVDGGWSAWSVWGECDRPCGTGSTIRTRQCTNPAPAHGGTLCQGLGSESKRCNEQVCLVPVNGGWAVWSEWGKCDKSCGSGTSLRTRTCTNPVPKHGGALCTGLENERIACNQQPCPVNGKWKPWTKWSPCDVICGKGTKTRTRTCISPKHGGQHCQGPSMERVPCITSLCPINGGWTVWSDWGQCNKSCGRGMQTRARHCSNPAPAHGGEPCDGPDTDFQPCTLRACIVDGKWSVWTGWAKCDVTCGDGTQTRTRECNNPAPSVGGLDCVGYGRQMQSCHRGPCPVPISWAPWGKWGVCSAPCDIGLQRRQRVCNSTFIGRSGSECAGDNSDYRICLPGACANGGWSLWNNWSTCSASCGTGTRSRARLCNNPAPSALGRHCDGEPSQTEMCIISKCQGDVPAFTVEKPATIINGKLTFSHVIFNQGDVFSPLSGEFVCTRPGTYFFSMSLVKKRDFMRIDKVFCNLYRNNDTIVYVGIDPTDDDTDKGNAQAHNAALVHLRNGDVVSLQGCSDPPSYYMEEWSSFSGFLLRPDS